MGASSVTGTGAGSAPSENKQVKVSDDDANGGFLETKITEGTNITISVLNPGEHEFLEISADDLTDSEIDALRRHTITSVQTGNYTAGIFETIRYDPSGGTFTIDMPASPTAGDIVRVKNVSSDVTAVTMDGNGNNIEDPTSSFALAASFSLVGDGISVTWEYSGSEWLAI